MVFYQRLYNSMLPIKHKKGIIPPEGEGSAPSALLPGKYRTCSVNSTRDFLAAECLDRIKILRT